MFIFLEISFGVYILVLHVFIFAVGLCYYRMKKSTGIQPEIILFLTPYCLNFVLAKTIFLQIHPLFTTLLPAITMALLGYKIRKVRLIGLTGGIATGKSTLIAQIQKNLKVEIIDCDRIAKQLSNKGRSGYNTIMRMLGENKNEFIHPLTQQLQRQKLSSYVFENQDFRRELTTRMGRFIMYELLKSIFMNIVKGRNVMIIDAPILYETKIMYYFCCPIIVVGCDLEDQISRLKIRNGYTRQQGLRRINSQMPINQKRKRCQIYVENNKTPEDMLDGVLTQLNQQLKSK